MNYFKKLNLYLHYNIIFTNKILKLILKDKKKVQNKSFYI